MPRFYIPALNKSQTPLTSIPSTRVLKLSPLLPSRQFGVNPTRKAPVSDKTKMTVNESNQSFKLENLFNVKDKGKLYITNTILQPYFNNTSGPHHRRRLRNRPNGSASASHERRQSIHNRTHSKETRPRSHTLRQRENKRQNNPPLRRRNQKKTRSAD